MTDLINTTLGSYQITELIRHGGMASVHKAYQTSLDRYVAVKVLLHSGDPQFAVRFKREARADCDAAQVPPEARLAAKTACALMRFQRRGWEMEDRGWGLQCQTTRFQVRKTFLKLH